MIGLVLAFQADDVRRYRLADRVYHLSLYRAETKGKIMTADLEVIEAEVTLG
jgi:hypothetical protein